MPRKPIIEDHPEREAIEHALLYETDSLRNIGARYGLSPAALLRWKKRNMASDIAKAQEVTEQKEIQSGDYFSRMIQGMLEKFAKVQEAADRELTDPDDPTRYTFDPRPDQVQVVYRTTDESGAVFTQRAPLQMLLDMCEGKLGIGDVQVTVKGYDKLRGLLDATKAVQGPLKLAMDAFALTHEREQSDITKHPEYPALETDMLRVVRKCPEAMREMERVFSARKSS